MVDIPTDEFDRKFIEAFGCTKEEFAKMKPWKQAELSKLTKLILEPTAETVATAPPAAPPMMVAAAMAAVRCGGA